MKSLNIDIERVDAAAYEAGMVRVLLTVTATEKSDGSSDSEMHMSEASMRRLHKVLGNIVRNLDEFNSRTAPPSSR